MSLYQLGIVQQIIRNEDLIVLNQDSVYVHACTRYLNGFARSRIELPSVPRTNDRSIQHDAVGYRSTSMRADVPQRSKLSVHASDTNRRPC